MLQLATPQQTTAMKAQEGIAAPAVPETPEQIRFNSSLAGHITQSFTESEQAKRQELFDRLLDCQRLRRGKYSAQEEAEIKEVGGSDVFVNLTNIKCRAAESWIKDIMLSQGSDKPWTLESTPIPDLPPEMSIGIAKTVAQEQLMLAQQGVEIHPDAFDARKEELHTELLQKLNDAAHGRARAMELRIDDQLKEGGFLYAFKEFINDFCTFPTAYIKGPIIKKRRTLVWGEQGPKVQEKLGYEFARVSPFDIYQAPDAVNINDGYFIERHRLFPADIIAMKGVAGYKDSEIDKVIELYGERGLVINRANDHERERLENRPASAVARRSTIEALQFWGPVLGSKLKQWADSDIEKMGLTALDDNMTYEVEAWLIGSIVIKAVLNPDPFGTRPYDKASWDEVPGSAIGMSVPELMADIQRMINACARALSNNMGIASGPQVEVYLDRLPPGTTNIDDIYPWKIWPMVSDKTGGSQPGVRFFQPNSNAAELQGIMDWFYKKADEVTGIPNYTYGSAAVGGAGRTASGLSMLMENASKGIRQAISNVDNALSSLITRMFNHNMLFDPDPNIKGDVRIVARGAMGMMAREALNARRNEFLAATANPIDAQILGMEGRAYLLHELAKGLQMDANKIVPSPEKLKLQQQQLMQQQEEQAAAQAAQQNAPMNVQFERDENGVTTGAQVS
jgi:hypothetical protein